ncbi:MAG: glycosyltransferase [Planctomycetes bacterium]|nr:glycosyltransferase [Planctomycetota bacterium]
MGAGVLILMVSVFASRPLAEFFRVRPAMVGDFRRVMLLLGLAATVNLIGQVHRATIAAHELFVPRNIVMIGITVFRAALTVVTLRAGWGLQGVAVSHLGADSVGFVLHLALIRRLTPYVKLWPRCVRWGRLWKLLGYRLTMTVIAAAGTLQIQAASLIIARFVSLEAVALYAVAALLMRYFANLIHSGVGVLAPRFAGLDGLDDKSRLRALMVKGLWASTMLSCAVGLSLLVLGPRFLELWVGARFTPEEVQTVSTVLILLTVTCVLALAQTPGDSVLYAMNRHGVFAVIMVVEALANLSLAILLAIHFGTVGVAFSGLVAVACIRTVAEPIYVSRVVGMAVVDYCYPIGVSIAAAVAVWMVWRWVVWPVVPQMGYGGLMVSGLAITATYVMVMVGVSAATAVAQGQPVETAVGLRWLRAIRRRIRGAGGGHTGLAVRGTPPRLCFVAHDALGELLGVPGGHIGGVERQVSLMARWFAASGCRVAVVTWNDPLEGVADTEGIEIIRTCGRDEGLVGLRFLHPRWTSLTAALRRADADLYYHNCGEYVTGQVALWCRRHGRKFVYSIANDPDCDRRLPMMRSGRERVLYRYGLRHAEAVISQTETQRLMLLEDFGLPSTVIPMPCPGPTDEQYAPPSLDGQVPRVLWIGRICLQKRPDRLLDVARACPELRFDLVGPVGSGAYAAEVCARADTIPNITLHGAVPRDQVPLFYRRSAVLINTSDFEGFPNTFLEAWSHGLPAVSTFDPDGRIALEELGFVAADTGGLIDALKTLMADSASYRGFSDRARRYYLQTHTPQAVMPLFRDVFAAVLGRSWW